MSTLHSLESYGSRCTFSDTGRTLLLDYIVDNVFVCDSGFVRGLGQQCDRQVQSADGT